MKTPVFRGAATALVTPFTKDGLNFEQFDRNIEYQIEQGINGLVVCGTTGEASTQTTPEHLETIARCVKTTAGRVPVIAGTGSNDTAHALEMSQAAEASGADALLIVTPYYNKTTQTGLIQHFTYLADRVNIPIILYNIPGRTGLGTAPATFKALSEHPNINGVKEASADFTLVARIRALCGDDLNVWAGNDDIILPILSMGGQGVITTMGNIIPKDTARIVSLWFEGKAKEAADLQISYQDLIDALFCEVNPIPVKTALNLMGFDCGPLRMPLCEMGAANRERLVQAMRNAGLMA